MDNEELADKVLEASELDEEEFQEKVDEKMDEFEGLVSEEGAIHLVAKEHGVDLSESVDEDLQIENIVPEMRKVALKARILNISDRNTFEREGEEEDGKVQNMLLGDGSDTVRVTLWDEQTEIADNVEEGDVIEMTGGYTVEDDRGNAELRLGDSAQVRLLEDDEHEIPEMEREEASLVPISDISSEGSSVRVTGMVMTMYTSNPFYRVDPDSGDTVREEEDTYVTDDGKEVENPDGRLAIPGVIDDGTGNIRAVFFGDQARELLDLSEEQEREMDNRAVEEAVEQVQGKEIEVQGRTRYNDYFGALEILVNEFDETSVDEEIEEILEIMEA